MSEETQTLGWDDMNADSKRAYMEGLFMFAMHIINADKPIKISVLDSTKFEELDEGCVTERKITLDEKFKSNIREIRRHASSLLDGKYDRLAMLTIWVYYIISRGNDISDADGGAKLFKIMPDSMEIEKYLTDRPDLVDKFHTALMAVPKGDE